MAMSDTKRDYTMTDAELCMFVSNLCNTITRDTTEFTDYSVDATTVSDLKALCDDFEDFPTDKELLADVGIAAGEKNLKAAELRNAMKNILVRATNKWGIDSPHYKKFGVGAVSRLNDKDLLLSARRVNRVAKDYLTELTPFGLTLDILNDFLVLIDDFEEALNGLDDAIAERDIKREERAKKGNELYALAVKYCNIGKQLWANVNPAKYDDYVIYSPDAGALKSPENFFFDFYFKTFWWDEVRNATSYQLQMADGETFIEIYSGSEPSYQFNPPDGKGLYRVRARNDNGFGPFGEILEQWYYAVLPPASNLQISETEIEPGKYNLTWDAVPTATEYSIYRSVVENGQPFADFSLQGKTAEPNFLISVESGKRNYFRVNTKNQNQYALPSVEVWKEI